ncbi:MAG: MASE1 domain-containing protein [Gemmatimonadaceae bacterium]
MKYVAQLVAVAAIYVIGARAGLQLDAVSGFATLVWPPTGIAFAALLLGGFRLWPGIFVGALIANVLTGAPIVVALGIAVGNTFEALLGTFALRRIPGFQLSLDRVVDAIGFIVLAAMLAPLVSATIGVASLELGGLVVRGQLVDTWRAWWLGDAIGALLVAPTVLAWATKPGALPHGQRFAEAAALTALVVIASLLVFVFHGPTAGAAFHQAYIFFPLLIWAAVRFDQRGAVSSTFIVSMIATWGTTIGNGPFADTSLHGSLFSLQTFMGVTAATFLVLGASIGERARVAGELQTALRVAATANRAKAEFLAVMSHELRTPLNAIAGYAELLSLGIAGPLTEKQADAVARIRRSEQQLLGLIDDVLSFAKIEAGTTEVHPRPLRVTDAFDTLEALVQPQVLHKGVVLQHEVSDAKLEVNADPTKLEQILLNIVGNAIKFTPPGGQVLIRAAPENGAVLISVVDTGIGVSAEYLERIFEPFFQIDSGTTRKYPGVGLGLAIARDLARAMGGDINFESEFGSGSKVSVVLPVPRAA